MLKSYNNKGLRLYHNHNQITFIHAHQWFRHDTIKLVVHATRTNGVVMIRSHSVGLNRKVFMFFPSVLSIGFSMRYNTSILFMTVGLVSLLYPPWKSGRNSYTNNVSGSSSSLIWELRGMQKFSKFLIKDFSIKHELSVTHHHVSFGNTEIKHELSIPHHHVS